MREYSPILGPVDSAFYYVEGPETPMNIGALTIFDGIIDFDALVTHIDNRLHQIPRYRDRIVQAPLNLGQPTWVPDPDFYIHNHVKRIRVDAPGSEKELRKLAGTLLSQTLDRNRPLWQIHVIEGLPNQTALFFKVHHCLVDGLAAVQLFTFLMDVNPEYRSAPIAHKPLYDPPPLPGTVELTLDSLVRDVSHQFDLWKKLGKESLRLGGVLTDREKRLKMLVAAAHLVNNNLKPIKKLPINGKNSGLQSMVWAEFALDEIHAIRAQCEASVNDVMLSLLTKAVERYTANHGGTDQPFLRLLVPVNVRDEAEKGDYGNRISVLPVDIPFNIDDPIEHLKATTRFTKVMKESSLAYSVDLMLTLPALLPAATHLPVWKLAPSAFSVLAHTWCTNVAAMPIPVYILGHELKHVYGYFPLNPSMGLAAVIVSYNQRITMTLITDQEIVKDSTALELYLKDAYDDLVSSLPAKKRLEPTVLESVIAPPNGVVKQNGNLSNGAKSVEASTEVAIAVEHLSNGAKSAEASTEVALKMIEQPTPVVTPVRYKLFSEGWAQAMREEINRSEDYRSASTNWSAGSLAFVIEGMPNQGFETPSAVWFDLYRGVCRASKKVSAQEALREATFVIQGDYPAWMDVLNGRAAPLIMITSGRLKLKKGALLRLLPHTHSASELVRCAQRVPRE